MHTKEPWIVSDYIYAEDGKRVASYSMISRDDDANEANARRIVACVNACRPLTTESLEMHGLAGITSSTERILREQCDTAMDERIAAGKRIEELERQRDELLAELERAQKWIAHRGNGLPDHACAQCVPHSDILIDGFVCAYHAAIAKVTQS